MDFVVLVFLVALPTIAGGCWLYILVDAFKSRIWKGVLYAALPPYALYYAIFEYRDEYRGWMLSGFLLGMFVILAIFWPVFFTVSRP